MALRQVTVPYKKGYDFGIGADLASGSPMGLVVDGKPTGVEHATGSTTEYKISRIHTTSELETRLGINVEASYGSGAFGAGISARFNFAKDSKIQSNSLFLCITSTVELPFLSIDDPNLTKNAIEIINRSDVFSAKYGNMFVRGIGRGGMFIGVIQINSSSSEDTEKISAELEGSYGLFSAEAEAKFEKIQKDYRSEIGIHVYHEGGPEDLIPDDITKPDQLIGVFKEWLTSFRKEPDKYSVPYYVTLAPIAIANGPIPPNIADIQHAQDVLVICANKRSDLLDGLNLMEYISQHSSKYDFVAPTTPAAIVKAANGYQSDLDIVAAAASQAINDVTKAKTPAKYAEAEGLEYQLGIPPDPMPTLKKGEFQPVVLQSFVGMTYGAAWKAIEELGLEPAPSNIDEVVVGDNFRLVYESDMIVTAHEPSAGVLVQPHSRVKLDVDINSGRRFERHQEFTRLTRIIPR